jgi:hypothetical protein
MKNDHHADTFEKLAIQYRTKKKSSPKAIFKRIRREQKWADPYGDYLLALGILKGCLICGKVSRHEYRGLVSLLPTRKEDDTRAVIAEMFLKYID